jgi:pimeloyl-ACP methyl ester carboxylesterase
MSMITPKNGVEIFYKDWGKGQPIVFSHGWPLAVIWGTPPLIHDVISYRSCAT